MSVNITFDGQPFIIAETGEVGWGGNTTSYLVAIAAGCLQKTGGSFTLSAETDFGASFGLKSLSYKSRTVNIADTGILRLANNSDTISWRNAANSADLPLIVDASNRLSYDSNFVLIGTGPSNFVSSIAGTANQVIASASTGAITLSLPQSINSSAAVQFGTLGLGSAIIASSILALTSTTLGFLPPRMTTAERDAISSPATGLFIYNTSTSVYNYFDGASWIAIAAGGTINSGTQFQLAHYAVNGTTLSGLTLITASRALESDSNGLPVASATTAAELAFVSGVTSAIQTQLDLKATDSLVVHLAGTETITGAKTFNAATLFVAGTEALPGIAFALDPGLGFRRAANDIIALSVNGLEQWRVTPDSFSIWSTVAPPDQVFISKANIGGVNTLQIANEDTTNPASDARIEIAIGGASAGDPFIRYNTTITQWVSGIDNSDSDRYKMSRDSVLGVNDVTIIDPTTLGVSIRGTNTNDSPLAGFVGEIISSSVTSFVNAAATGTFGNITSISLTAGDWVITGQIQTALSGATMTRSQGAISVNSGNTTTDQVNGINNLDISVPTATSNVGGNITYRLKLASTTTIFLKASATYSSGTPKYLGSIFAARTR